MQEACLKMPFGLARNWLELAMGREPRYTDRQLSLSCGTDYGWASALQEVIVLEWQVSLSHGSYIFRCFPCVSSKRLDCI